MHAFCWPFDNVIVAKREEERRREKKESEEDHLLAGKKHQLNSRVGVADQE